jgi:O-antigen ligase
MTTVPRPVRTAPTNIAAAAPAQPGKLAFFLFCLLTFVTFARPQDYIVALVPLRLAMILTVIGCLVTVITLPTSKAGSILRERETRLYLAFYAAMIAGIAFSVYRPGSFEVVITRYIVNVCFFLLFVTHVNSVERLKTVGSLLVMAIFIFTLAGLSQGHFIQGRYDTGSSMYDPNDVAFVEVSLLAFALWIVVGRFSKLMKAIALTSILGGILLVLFTASRGGLLGLLAFFVLFLCLRVNNVGGRFKIVLLLALVVVAVANGDKINVDRYRTMELGSVQNDYNFQAGGRTDIWERGWQLFLRSPITGVGVEGFGKAIGDMRAEEFGVIPKWQTAHSTYVLVLTETGILGTVPFALLLVGTLLTFNRLRRGRNHIHDADLAALPGLLLIGFGAQLVAASFLSQTYSSFFTLAFALAATLNRLTRVAAAVPVPAAEPAVPSPYARYAVHPRTR